MKILKHGNNNEYVATCKRCMTMFVYKVSDVRQVMHMVGPRVSCPVCNHQLVPSYTPYSQEVDDEA